MRRIILFLVALLGLSGAIQALAQSPLPIPITGNLGAVSGTGQPYAGVQILLQNCASPVRIFGYMGIVQQGYDIRASSAGLVSTTIWPNDLIDCNGTTGLNYYSVALMNNGTPSGSTQCYQVTSAQGIWNMNTQLPIPCRYPVPDPQDAQYRNVNITGCLSVDGSACLGSTGFVLEVNGTPISPPTPGNFVDTASVTWAFTGGQIKATATGGCGALSDVTSTNCGNGNQVGNTGTSISTFGYQNVDGANAKNLVTAIGTNNYLNPASGTGAQEVLTAGDSNFYFPAGATLSGGHNGDIVLLGDSNGNYLSTETVTLYRDVAYMGDSGADMHSADSVVGGGISACSQNGQAGTYQDVVCFGNGAASDNSSITVPYSLTDIVALGDGAGAQNSGTLNDIVAIGDGSGSRYATGTHDIVAIGDGAAGGYSSGGVPSTTVDNFIGVGYGSGSNHGTGSSDIGGFGDTAAQQLSATIGADTNTDDVYAVGHNVCDSLGASSSDVFCFGHNINAAPGITLTNAIGIGPSILLASNSTVIGNSSMTALTIFGSGDGCLSSTSGVITGSGVGCAGGGSGLSGQTAGYAVEAATATTATGPFPMDDGITTANRVTIHKATDILDPTDPTQFTLAYNSGHVPTGTAVSAVIAPDTTGNLTVNPNDTAFGIVPPLASGFVSGDCGEPTSSAGVWTIADSGSPCGGGSGTVTSVGFTGGLISVGSPTTTPAFTVAGTSGGVPYFSSASTWASSAALPAGDFVLGGGAGSAPTATFSVVPVANGGTGTGSTLTGLMRGSASAMTAAELSGDATTSGSNAVTVVKINGTSLAGLATGILKNTTGTGVPSIATAGTDYVAPKNPAILYTNAEYSNSTCTTAATISAANGNRQNVTLTDTDTCALTFTQPASGTITITLKVIQSSAGAFSGKVSGCKWPGGTVPTITETTGAIDFISAYLDGTNAYCVASQNFQ